MESLAPAMLPDMAKLSDRPTIRLNLRESCLGLILMLPNGFDELVEGVEYGLTRLGRYLIRALPSPLGEVA